MSDYYLSTMPSDSYLAELHAALAQAESAVEELQYSLEVQGKELQESLTDYNKLSAEHDEVKDEVKRLNEEVEMLWERTEFLENNLFYITLEYKTGTPYYVIDMALQLLRESGADVNTGDLNKFLEMATLLADPDRKEKTCTCS